MFWNDQTYNQKENNSADKYQTTCSGKNYHFFSSQKIKTEEKKNVFKTSVQWINIFNESECF